MGEEIDFEELLKADKIELENDVEKVLVLKNWRVEDLEFERKGKTEMIKALQFDVYLEDNEKPTTDIFSVTSKRLIKKLRPIVEKAIEKDTDTIKVGIIKTGEGFDTQYVVREQKL
jgi:hypothetical protein